MDKKKPLLFSIPHSGEQVPEEAYWLKGLPEVTLMYDVDRFVDRLYEPGLKECQIPGVVAPYHRYAIDCNRWPDEVDRDTLEYSIAPSGLHPRGLHWRNTTTGLMLIKKPLTRRLNRQLVKKCYEPFYEKVDALYKKFEDQKVKGVYHLDLHSMPSKGTAAHRDPGGERADIVLGTKDAKIRSPAWVELVKEAYTQEGFKVALNTPYKGGAVVERYHHPEGGRHSIMVELNRRLYMDEQTKKWLPGRAQALQKRLARVISHIYSRLP